MGFFFVFVCSGSPFSSMQASWPFCLTSPLSGCISPELGGGDPRVLTSCLGLLFPPDFTVWYSIKQIPEEASPFSWLPGQQAGVPSSLPYFWVLLPLLTTFIVFFSFELKYSWVNICYRQNTFNILTFNILTFIIIKII